MNAQLLGFGEIEVEGTRYDADVVIERGQVRRRSKKPSKPYRGRVRPYPAVGGRVDPVGAPP